MTGLAARLQRLEEARPWKRIASLVAFGALAALGHAPLNLWPLTFLALAVLFALYIQVPHWKRAAGVGFYAGVGYFAISLSWIIEPFLVDPVRHAWLAPFAILGVSVGFALFWAASFGVARALGGRAFAWVGAFAGFEALRGWLMTGFSWSQVGHVVISTPWLYWASWSGALGLIMLVLTGAVALWHLVAGHRAFGAVTAGALVALYIGGTILTPAPFDDASAPEAPTVRLIQPNAPQHEKWDPDKLQVFYDRQVEFTAAPAEDGARPDIVIWPETSVPVMLNHAEDTLTHISAAAQGSEVVLGFRRWDGTRIFNSLVYLDAAGRVAGIYDKHHLVPFGEFMPLGNVLSRFGIHGLAAETGDGFSAGPGPQVLDMTSIGAALPLICYEGVFARNLFAPERPNVLLMITNDAWFGQVSGPYQHLAMARLRSVEQGLPMVRAANTGVSAVIDGAGHVISYIPLGEAGWIDAALPPALDATVYSKTGDLPWVLLSVLLCGLGVTRARVASGRT